MKRITAPPVAPSAIVLQPRSARRFQDLPPFEVEWPASGWTLETAQAAALRYAAKTTDDHGISPAGLARAAFRAIAEAEDPRPASYPEGAHWTPRLNAAEIRSRLAPRLRRESTVDDFRQRRRFGWAEEAAERGVICSPTPGPRPPALTRRAAGGLSSSLGPVLGEPLLDCARPRCRDP